VWLKKAAENISVMYKISAGKGTTDDAVCSSKKRPKISLSVDEPVTHCAAQKSG
jgi:hypothetical protein